MDDQEPVVGRRECPGGLMLVYTLDRFGNFSNVLRNGYVNRNEVPRARGFTYGPVVNDADFQKYMDGDRNDFLARHLKPD